MAATPTIPKKNPFLNPPEPKKMIQTKPSGLISHTTVPHSIPPSISYTATLSQEIPPDVPQVVEVPEQYKKLGRQIRIIVREVYQILGKGFQETIYQTAITKEFQMVNVMCDIEVPMPVPYKRFTVGGVYADIIVHTSPEYVIETKTEPIKTVKIEDEWQLLRYMKILDLQFGVLVNFPQIAGTVEPYIGFMYRPDCTDEKAYYYDNDIDTDPSDFSTFM